MSIYPKESDEPNRNEGEASEMELAESPSPMERGLRNQRRLFSQQQLHGGAMIFSEHMVFL